MKTLIKALLAASMLVPVAAQAQDGGERREGRGEWHRRDGGARGDREAPQRSAEVGVEAQIRTERPQRGAFQADRGPQQQQQQQQQQFRQADPGGRQDRRAEFRGDDARAGGFEQQQQAQQRQQFQARQDGGNDGRRDDRRDRQAYRQPGYQQDRGGYQGNIWQGNTGQGNRWQGNSARGYGDGRAFNDGRNYANRGYDSRNGWNRGWRNDDRYDWSRYRAVNRSAYRLPRYYAPSGWGYGYRRFSIGVSLSSILFSENYWIDDPYAYRLPEAYGPFRWVRYYDDALLVDIRSGQVVDTVYDIFD